MNRNRFFKPAFISIVIAIALALALKHSAPLPRSASDLFHSPETSQATSAAKPESSSQIPTPTAGEALISAHAPSIETLRNEATENPHETPRSLTEFALKNADRIEKAKQSETEAQKLLPELTDCALRSSSELAVQIRTWCAINAIELQKLWPSIRDNTNSFESSLEPDVKALLQKRRRIAR